MSQVAFEDAALCSVADVRKTNDNCAFILRLSKSSPDIDSIIENKIAYVKEHRIKPLLLQEARRIFPKVLKDFTAKMRAQLNLLLAQRNENAQTSGIDFVSMGYDYSNVGNYISLTGIEDSEPKIAINYGVPSSTNNLKNGSIILNTAYYATNGAYPVYINRGSDTATDWDVYRVDDLIDFILNIEDVFIESASYGTLMLMAEEGTFRNMAGSFDQQVRQTNDEMVGYFEMQFSNALHGTRDENNPGRKITPGALELVQWDISGDGILSDYEISVNEGRPMPFV